MILCDRKYGLSSKDLKVEKSKQTKDPKKQKKKETSENNNNDGDDNNNNDDDNNNNDDDDDSDYFSFHFSLLFFCFIQTTWNLKMSVNSGQYKSKTSRLQIPMLELWLQLTFTLISI